MLIPSRGKRDITINPEIVLYAFGTPLVLMALFQLRDIILQIFLAFLLMTAVRPMAGKLQKVSRLPRVFAIVLVYLMLILFLFLTTAIIIPPLVFELQTLLRTFGILNELPLQEQILSVKFSVQELSSLLSGLGQSVSVVTNVLTATFSGVFSLVTILIISIYLLLERDHLSDRIGWFSASNAHHDLADRFLTSVELQLGGWVRGQLLLMLAIGVVTYIGLLLLQVPYALPLALLAGLLEVLPNLGPTVAAIPAVVIGFTAGGPVIGLLVLVFYILVQQLEATLIVPKVMQDSANVSPLATIISILVGFRLAGVAGALLAIPIYIVGRTVYSFWLESRR